MSKLYREGLKMEKAISHIGFLKVCLKSNLVPKGLSFRAESFEKEVANALATAEKLRIENEIVKNEDSRKKLSKTVGNLEKKIGNIFTDGEKKKLMDKFLKSRNNWRKMLSRKKNKKLKDLKNKMKNKDIETQNYEIEEMFGEFWEKISYQKKRRRKLSKKKKIVRRKINSRKRRLSTTDNNIYPEEEHDTETWARDFLENVAGDKVIKVKNFSKDPIPAEIEAFCSLGPKACPVELDVNTARLDTEINAFFRRLKLTKHFEDSEDQRDEEEKHLYTRKPDFIPEGGKSAQGGLQK